MKTDIKTATIMAQSDNRKRFAMMRLLDSLRRFMRAYPALESQTLPEHKIVWVTGMEGDGPDAVIAKAMMRSPELWISTLHDAVAIVSKATLLRIAGNNPDVVDYMGREGVAIVENASLRESALPPPPKDEG